ncbi:hypothetical protein ACIBCD_13930 [Nocardia brasiliensis]
MSAIAPIDRTSDGEIDIFEHGVVTRGNVSPPPLSRLAATREPIYWVSQ